jgi:tetratricopeptide (TPR) repeat protein
MLAKTGFMKKIALLCLLPFLPLLFVSLRTGPRLGRDGDVSVGCGPELKDAGPDAGGRPDADGRYAPAFKGWGHYHYSVSTADDSAQYYFDQGLSLYYGYHLKESLASFRESAVKDSNCAMAYWGQALAMGPYYNNTYYYKEPAQVLPVLMRMRQLSDRASAKERDLIVALAEKYSEDTTDSRRPELNRAYSEHMKALIGKYPGDLDIKALYIDGMMIEHAWDMWDPQGNPKAWTPELVSYCKAILATNPDHPAALHYHIHLLEASRHPEEILASADKLKDEMPGVAHMVHMASHSYQRNGLFEKGVRVNDSANAAQVRYLEAAPQVRIARLVIHYYAVEAFCAMSGGMYEKAMQSGGQCEQIVASGASSVPGLYLQYLYMLPVFAEVRMGKWQAILDRPAPDERWVYARLLSDFARGMAFVRTGKLSAAEVSLDSLRQRLKDPVLAEVRLPGNAPVEGASVAAGILEGELLFARGKTEDAIAVYSRAVGREDGMTYMEPKDWILPARQFFGARLLGVGRAADAEKVYREDLVHNPGCGWSLLGLANSLDAQHKKGGEECRARAREAFAQAEEVPKGSAY